MTTLQIIGLIIAIPCVGLAGYLICKRLYQMGYIDGTEAYQKICHKERLLLEIELRKAKKITLPRISHEEAIRRSIHPCDGCDQGWATNSSDGKDRSCRDNCEILMYHSREVRPFVPIIHP